MILTLEDTLHVYRIFKEEKNAKDRDRTGWHAETAILHVSPHILILLRTGMTGTIKTEMGMKKAEKGKVNPKKVNLEQRVASGRDDLTSASRVIL